MNIDKLFGSKTKVDILKYLLFRRQGISMRALESELPRTFPAIKKQVDSLLASQVIDIDKDKMKRAITLDQGFANHLKQLFMFALQRDVADLFTVHEFSVKKYYLGKIFGRQLEMDLVIIHNNLEKDMLESLKTEISQVFRNFFIETISVTFMSSGEWEKRERLADRFVLTIMRSEDIANRKG